MLLIDLHTLFKSSSIYVLTELVVLVISLFMFPVYTRYLTPADYGVISILLLSQSFIVPFASLQLHHSVRRFYFDFKDNILKEYISTILISIIFIASLVIILSSLILFNYYEYLFELDTSYIKYFIYYTMLSMFVILINFCKYILRCEESSYKYFYISIISCFLSTFFMIHEVVISNNGLFGAIIAGIYSNIISTILFLFTVRKYFCLKFNFSYFRDSLKFSIPIIPHSLCTIVFLYSDRFILQKYVPITALGLFFAADRISSVFKNIINQINNAIQPYYFNKLKLKIHSIDSLIYSTYNLFFISYLLILIPITLLIKPLISILLDDSYFNCALMIPLMGSCYLFRILYCYFSTFIVFEKKTIYLTKCSIYSGIINILLNIIFIPKYGIYAAIYTTIVSFFILLLFSYYYCNKIKTVPFNIKFFILSFFYFFIIYYLLNIINSIFTDIIHISFVYIFLLVLSFLLFYKPLIKSFRHVYNS